MCQVPDMLYPPSNHAQEISILVIGAYGFLQLLDYSSKLNFTSNYYRRIEWTFHLVAKWNNIICFERMQFAGLSSKTGRHLKCCNGYAFSAQTYYLCWFVQ